jgi:MFS family permease
LAGSIVLIGLGQLTSAAGLITAAFLAAVCFSIALPSMNGAYADYIHEANPVATDIEALEDFASNVGFIIGPILAGFLADQIGQAHTFSAVGLLGVLLMTTLLMLTPRHLKVSDVRVR